MAARHRSSDLAGAAALLNRSSIVRLGRFASALPSIKSVDTAFRRELRAAGYSHQQVRTLAAIRFSAACQILPCPSGAAKFLEQVQYSGRRLAKLGLSPRRALDALRVFHGLLPPEVRALADYGWSRELVESVTALALNNAFYDIRQAETEAFYDLFRSELESRSVTELLDRSLRILAKLCRADAGQIYLLDAPSGAWIRQTSLDGRAPARVTATKPVIRSLGRPRCLKAACHSAVLDVEWEGRYQTVWSVPLLLSGRLEGVLQFGFTRAYPWLPREREMLTVAGERCLSGVEKARLTENLRGREEEVRRLAKQVLQVEELERRRISRELHDETGQSLLFVRLQMEMLERTAAPDAREAIGQTRAEVERIIAEVRRLIGALSPSVLERFGLAAAVRQVASTLRNGHGLRVRLEHAVPATLPEGLQLIAYRLVQECCNNVAKHASARNVKISIQSADKWLRLEIEDDGSGFDAKETLRKNTSFGIAGMRERVALAGGELRITSRTGESAGSGTKVHIQLPITDDSHGQNENHVSG